MLASTQSDSPEAVLDQGQSLISMTALFAFIVLHLAVSITEKIGDLQNDIVSSRTYTPLPFLSDCSVIVLLCV